MFRFVLYCSLGGIPLLRFREKKIRIKKKENIKKKKRKKKKKEVSKFLFLLGFPWCCFECFIFFGRFGRGRAKGGGEREKSVR